MDRTEDDVFEFLELSRKLLTLIEHENRIMSDLGCLSLEGYLAHRDALLRKYETKASEILEMEDVQDEGIRRMMVTEISQMRELLNDNTKFAFNTLEQRLSKRTGETSWH